MLQKNSTTSQRQTKNCHSNHYVLLQLCIVTCGLQIRSHYRLFATINDNRKTNISLEFDNGDLVFYLYEDGVRIYADSNRLVFDEKSEKWSIDGRRASDMALQRKSINEITYNEISFSTLDIAFNECNFNKFVNTLLETFPQDEIIEWDDLSYDEKLKYKDDIKECIADRKSTRLNSESTLKKILEFEQSLEKIS